jgi:phosphoglycolate phosphatase-like HAD superfamily hydrolase
VRVTIALFDIDGTLLRAGGAGRRALELALADVLGGVNDVSLDSVEFAGRTDPWIVAQGLAKHGVDGDEALVAEVLNRYLVHLPEQLDLARTFEVLPGAHSEARAVVIGDTPHDVRAARAIGADCIAVSTGHYRAAALEAAGARVVVSDLRAREVLQVLG